MDEASRATTVATLEPQGLVDAELNWTEGYSSQADASVRDVPLTQVTTADSASQILPLICSPILVHGSYFQFYYKQDHVCLPNALAMASKRETPGQKPIKQGHVLLSSPPKSQIKPETDAQINTLAMDPYLNGGRSRIHFQTNREQQLASVSADQQAESVNTGTAITIRRFKSESSKLGGPKSPEVVNVLHDLQTASIPDPPVTEATEDRTTVDVMLSAANEVRRRRARRKELRSSASSQENANSTDRDGKPLIKSEDKREALQHELLEKEAHTSAQITGNGLLSNSQLMQTSAVISETQQKSQNATFSSHDHHDLANSPKKANASSVLDEKCNTQSLEFTLESRGSEPLESPALTPHQDQYPVFSPPFTIPQNQLSTTSSKPHKSVAFLWRLLGRASFRWPANLQVAVIQNTEASNQDDLALQKGQQLKALYRISNRVFVQTLQNQRGFIPYKSCRISRRHYGSASKIMRMSYSQLYIQSPDGIDSGSIQFPSDPPSIEVVTIQDCNAVAKEDLAVRAGEKLRVLYCDNSWVYAVSEQRNAGFLPRFSCRLTRKCQKLYKNWISSQSHFQADFTIKFSEPPPLAVKRNIQKPLSLTCFPSQASTPLNPLSLKPSSLGNLPSQFTTGMSMQKPSSLSNVPSHAITVGQKPLSVTLSLPSQAPKAKTNILEPLLLPNLPRKTHASKIGKIMIVARNYVPSFGDPSLTICKGLRVWVTNSDGDLLHVVTKSGIPFWIPSNYLRPAMKTSNSSNFFNFPVLDAPLTDDDIDAPIPEMALPQHQIEHDEHVYESISSSQTGKVAKCISGGELPFNNLSTKSAVLAHSSNHVSDSAHNITATRRVKAQNSCPKLPLRLQDSVESLKFV